MIKISGKMDKSLNTVGDKVDKAFHKMMSAAKKLAVAGASAITGVTTAAIHAGKDYEAQMSTVGAISGASITEMEQLEKKAKEMGATTKFTATESGQAMEYMAMAGWKSKQMLGGIEGIMNLAAASGEDLASTSDIVTDALTAFKLTAEDSGHFADVLAKASSNSNTNVAMMGETFKYTASVAGALGYSVEDTAVSIGLLANAGIKASQAGTTIRKIMSETASGINLVSKAYSKDGKKLGKMKIETANKDGSMKAWSDTVGRLREEFSRMTEEEQAANAESIAGKTAMAGLLSIVNASEEDYKKLTREINNASGATKEMADIRMDNLQGDIQLFQSALEGKGIELYDEIKEPLRDLVQGATDWIDGIDVARIAEDFRNVGEAVMDFASPFLSVGEWMLEHPNIIAGSLTGIGSAITAYKLFDTVSGTAKGIQKLGASLVANPWITGGALAVGAIAGIRMAVRATQQDLADASLDEHFGDISMSMDEIRDSADKIIGKGSLDNVRKLLKTTDVPKGLIEDMEKASEAIEGIEWKVSAGISLDGEDMDSLDKNVKEYVSSAQDLIEKKGYAVHVATNVLFGNSAEGKELIREDNAFFASLSMEAEGLAARINSTLEKAMKEGLTPDLQETLDEYLDQLEKISADKSKATADAKWDVLETEFTGKELDAETFERMQEAVNGNIEEIEAGAKEALQISLENSNWKKEQGYISEEENQQEKKSFQEAYQKNIDEANRKAAEFYYNTLMDTYGEEIASGDYGQGDRTAIREIVAKMKELAPDGGEGAVFDVLDGAFNPKGGPRSDLTGMSTTEEMSLLAGQFASDYIDGKGLSEEAAKVGNETADSLRNSFAQDIAKGINADTTLRLSGTYSASFSGTPAAGGGPPGEEAVKSGRPANKGSGGIGTAGAIGSTISNYIPGHATGTISTKEHLAMVSERDTTEAIIPIDGSERSQALYEETGRLMGIPALEIRQRGQPGGAGKNGRLKRLRDFSRQQADVHQGGGNITFSPSITVHVNGSATKEDGKKIGDAVQKAIEKAYRKMVRDNQRFKMG